MRAFHTLTAIAAPLPINNVDTDMIVPARYLSTISREGLKSALFSALREEDEFILNRSPYNVAAILISLNNFGCGSSREHAQWALLDFGVRCIIATSVADIFYNNCCKNGILPIVLDEEVVERLIGISSNPLTAEMTIDLPRQVVSTGDDIFPFKFDPRLKNNFLVGLDEIGQTLKFINQLSDYEAHNRATYAWMPEISEMVL